MSQLKIARLHLDLAQRMSPKVRITMSAAEVHELLDSQVQATVNCVEVQQLLESKALVTMNCVEVLYVPGSCCCYDYVF